MGIRYKGLSDKQCLPVGFSVVKSPNTFGKYTIYEKGRNGIIYSGIVVKVLTLSLIKIPMDMSEPRTSIMDLDWCEKYSDCVFNLNNSYKYDNKELVETRVKGRLVILIIDKPHNKD